MNCLIFIVIFTDNLSIFTVLHKKTFSRKPTKPYVYCINVNVTAVRPLVYNLISAGPSSKNDNQPFQDIYAAGSTPGHVVAAAVQERDAKL